MQEIPKWELMQQVKSILVRYGTDLSLAEFSVSKTTIYLSGLLRKDPSGDFSANQLTIMLKELANMPNYPAVRADFVNWEIEDNYGEFIVKPRKLQLGGTTTEE